MRQDCPVLVDNPLSGPAVALSLLTLGFFDPWPGAQVNCAVHEEKGPTWAHPRSTILHTVQGPDVEYGFLLQCPWMQLMVSLLERAQQLKSRGAGDYTWLERRGFPGQGPARMRKMMLLEKSLAFQTGFGTLACCSSHSLLPNTTHCLYLHQHQLGLARCSSGSFLSVHIAAHSSNAELPLPSPSPTNFDGSGTIQISCF